MSSNDNEISASEIKDVFKLFDKNQDHYVHTDELGTMLRAINLNPTELELVELKKKVDSSNSGQFNLQQFETLVRMRGQDTDTLKEMIDALKVFDSDGDGHVTKDELLYALLNMGEKMTNEEVMEILEDVEVDERNGIKLEEFAKQLMSKI